MTVYYWPTPQHGTPVALIKTSIPFSDPLPLHYDFHFENHHDYDNDLRFEDHQQHFYTSQQPYHDYVPEFSLSHSTTEPLFSPYDTTTTSTSPNSLLTSV